MRYSRLLFLLLALLLGTSSSSALLAQPTPASGVQCSQLPADTSDGGRALAAGDYAAAESHYRAVLTAPSIAGYIGLVSAQLEQNHVTDALASAQKAAAAMPNSGDAEALVGDALLRAGQIPEASTAYIKALTLDRCSAIGHYGWGRLNELVGRHATAAKELNIAHRLAPASAQITAAVIETVPIAQRVSLLSQFLGQHPALPPDRLQKLEAEQHQLEQHQTCSPTAEFATAEITLFPRSPDRPRRPQLGHEAGRE